MNFDLTPEQESIHSAVTQLCTQFPESYWRERDIDGVFPEAFYRAMGEAGWLGIAIPEAYGGAGLGVQEAAVMMQAVAESGACMSGASSIHINVFGLMPVVVFGTEEQKQRMLPPMAKGRVKSCFGVTCIPPVVITGLTDSATRNTSKGDGSSRRRSALSRVTLNTSNGPQKSSTSTSGKTRTPVCRRTADTGDCSVASGGYCGRNRYGFQWISPAVRSSDPGPPRQSRGRTSIR